MKFKVRQPAKSECWSGHIESQVECGRAPRIVFGITTRGGKTRPNVSVLIQFLSRDFLGAQKWTFDIIKVSISRKLPMIENCARKIDGTLVRITPAYRRDVPYSRRN
jgi:hypothetical protein